MDVFRTISEMTQAVIMNLLAFTTFGAEQTCYMIATLPANAMNSMRSFIYPKTLPAPPPAPVAAAPEMPAYTPPLVFAPDNLSYAQYMTGTTSMSIEPPRIPPTYPVVRQNPRRSSLQENVEMQFFLVIIAALLASALFAFLFFKFRRPQIIMYSDEDLKRDRDELRAQLSDQATRHTKELSDQATSHGEELTLRHRQINVRNTTIAQFIQQVPKLTQQIQAEAARNQQLEIETKRQKDKLSEEIDGLKESLEQSQQKLSSLVIDSEYAQTIAKEKIEEHEDEIKHLTGHLERKTTLSTDLRKEMDRLLNDKSDLESKLKLKQETTNATLRETRSTIRELQELVATEQREKKEMVRKMTEMAEMAKQWEDETVATDKLNIDQATQIKELKWQNKEFRDELAKQVKIPDVSTQDLQKALEQMRAQNKGLSSNLVTVKSNLAAVNEKLADAEGVIAKSKTTFADSKAEYDEQIRANTSLQRDNKLKDEQVTDLKNKNQVEQEENRKLRRDIINLNREKSRLSEECNGKSLEVTDLKLQCTKNNLTATELRSEIAKLEEIRRPALNGLANKYRKDTSIPLEILKFAHDEATRSRRKRNGATTKRKPAPKDTPRRLRSKTVAYKDLKAKHGNAVKEAAQLRDEIAAVKKTIPEQVTSLPTTGLPTTDSEAEHQKELARLRSEHKAALAATITAKDGEITNLRSLHGNHETDLQNLRNELNAEKENEIARLKEEALVNHNAKLRDTRVAAEQRRQQTVKLQQQAHSEKIDELTRNHAAALQSVQSRPTEDLNAKLAEQQQLLEPLQQDEEDLVDAASTYNFDQSSALLGSAPPGGYFTNAERAEEEDGDADDGESCFQTLEDAPATLDDDALADMADVMPDEDDSDGVDSDDEMPDPAMLDESGMDHHGDMPPPQPKPSGQAIPSPAYSMAGASTAYTQVGTPVSGQTDASTPSPAIPGLGLLGPQPATTRRSPAMSSDTFGPFLGSNVPQWGPTTPTPPPAQSQFGSLAGLLPSAPGSTFKYGAPSERPNWGATPTSPATPSQSQSNRPPPHPAVAGIAAPLLRPSPLRQSSTPEQALGTSIAQILQALSLPYYPPPGVTPTPAPGPAPAPHSAPRAVAPSTSTRTHDRAITNSNIDPNLGGLTPNQQRVMNETYKELGLEVDEPDAESDPTYDPNDDEGFHETPSANASFPAPAPLAPAPAPQTPAPALPANPYNFVARTAQGIRSSSRYRPDEFAEVTSQHDAEEPKNATEEVLAARRRKPMRKRRIRNTNDTNMQG